MADTDALTPYVPKAYPTIPGGEARYIMDELRKMQHSVAKLISVMAALEARIVALEP